MTLFLAVLTIFSAWADDSGSCGDDVTYYYEQSTYTLTISGTGAMTNFSAYSTPWYSYRTSIRTVNIESGVTSIGNWAFWDCDVLTSITIPNSVTSIGNNAFLGCSGINTVKVSVDDYSSFCGNQVLGLIFFNIGKPVARKTGNILVECLTSNLVALNLKVADKCRLLAWNAC